MSYSQRAWRETMRDLGGHAERVGLALEQLADGEGRIPRPYTAGLGALCGLDKRSTRNGANALRMVRALQHCDGYALLLPSLTAQRTPEQPTPKPGTVPMVYRFDSTTGTWDQPVAVSDYLARKVAA